MNNLLETQAKDFLKLVFNIPIQIDEQQLDLLINAFELVSYNKKHVIIEEGKVVDYYYFIYKGLIKVYSYKNKRKIIERFERESVLFGGNFSHLSKMPSVHAFESIEDVVLLRIKYTDLVELCRKYHDIERLYRVFMEIFHINNLNRISSLKSLSSVERYYEFLEKYENIAKRVSIQDTANYLGMKQKR